MAKVSVTLNGRSFTIGCEDGQEAYLTELAGDLDKRVRAIGQQVGDIGDLRLLLMAALVVEDELREARRRTEAAEALTDRLRRERDGDGDRARSEKSDIAARLIAAAERLEAIAEAVDPQDDASDPASAAEARA